VGGYSLRLYLQSGVVLGLFSESPCWKPIDDMFVKIHRLGVGILNIDLYAVSWVEK